MTRARPAGQTVQAAAVLAGHGCRGSRGTGSAGPRWTGRPGDGPTGERGQQARVPGGEAGRGGALGGRGRARVLLRPQMTLEHAGAESGRAGHRARATAELTVRVPVPARGALAGAGVDCRRGTGGIAGRDGWEGVEVAGTCANPGAARSLPCELVVFTGGLDSRPRTGPDGRPGPWTPAPEGPGPSIPTLAPVADGRVPRAATNWLQRAEDRRNISRGCPERPRGAAKHPRHFWGGVAAAARPDGAGGQDRGVGGWTERGGWNRAWAAAVSPACPVLAEPRCGGSRQRDRVRPPLPRSPVSCCAKRRLPAGAFG